MTLIAKNDDDEEDDINFDNVTDDVAWQQISQ